MKSTKPTSQQFPFSVTPTKMADQPENQGLLNLVGALESQYSEREDWMDSGDFAQAAHMIAGDRANVSTVVPIFGEKSQKTLQQNIDEMRQNAIEGRATLMPIQLNGNHYTAGMMAKSASGKLQFLYNDSFGKEMPEQLREALGKDVEIIDMQVAQQKNDYECGNHALANMRSFLDLGFGTQGFDEEALKEEMKKKKKLKLSEDKDRLEEIPQSESPQEKAKDAAFNNFLESVFGKNYEDRIKRKKDGTIDSIGCSSPEEAEKVANGMKEFCDKIGLPCQVTDKGNGCYMVGVKMPPEFKGRDPFSMNQEELDGLKAVLDRDKERASEKEREESKVKEGQSAEDIGLNESKSRAGALMNKASGRPQTR